MDAEYARLHKKIQKDFWRAEEHIAEIFELIRQDPQNDDKEWLRKNLSYHCDLLTDMSTYLDDQQYALSEFFGGEFRRGFAEVEIISNHAPIQ